MAQIESWFDQDLKKPVKVHHIPGNVFTQDNDGNLIGVRVYDHGEAVSLSGSVSANVIRPDGGTVAVSGTLSGNQASVSLPQAAYAYPGMIAIVIKLTSGTTVTTLCAVTAIVYRSSTDTIIDPGTIIPDVQALIAAIDEAVDSIPPDYSELTGEVSSLKNAFNDISNLNVNLFDRTQATLNKKTSGNSASDLTGCMYTGYFPINPGDTIITKYFSTIGVDKLYLYNSSKTFIGSISGVRDGGYVTYTASNASSIAYGVINSNAAWIDSLMIVKGTSYPSIYKPYNKVVLNESVALTETQQQQIDNEFAYITNKTVNLFDKTSTDIQNGYYSSGFQPNANYRASHPISVKANVTYKYPHSSSMGVNYQIAVLDINGDYSAYTVGTYSNGFVTFSLTYDAKVRVNIGKTVEMQTFVFAEESKFPTKYQPYGFESGKTIYPNANYRFPEMLGKKIVFDGDSICRGASDTTPGESYPARIGNDAGMEWYNVGVSGGTIAVVSGISHNLCTYIDTIISQHPDLDYLILEGGTNDADRLLAEGLGELSAVDNFSGSYNTATFYGAMETLFYKAINAYPGKKIGFIIAMKMGTSATLLNRRRGYFDAAINVCKKWGIPFLDLWDGCKMNPCIAVYYDSTKTADQNIADGKYYADGQHPTAVGYDYLYHIIEKWIATL